jgi:hypothetical protein
MARRRLRLCRAGFVIFAIKFQLNSLLGVPGEARSAKPGGANRIRTGDLLNAIQALYQLSYSPMKRFGLKDL